MEPTSFRAEVKRWDSISISYDGRKLYISETEFPVKKPGAIEAIKSTIKLNIIYYWIEIKYNIIVIQQYYCKYSKRLHQEDFFV